MNNPRLIDILREWLPADWSIAEGHLGLDIIATPPRQSPACDLCQIEHPACAVIVREGTMYLLGDADRHLEEAKHSRFVKLLPTKLPLESPSLSNLPIIHLGVYHSPYYWAGLQLLRAREEERSFFQHQPEHYPSADEGGPPLEPLL